MTKKRPTMTNTYHHGSVFFCSGDPLTISVHSSDYLTGIMDYYSSTRASAWSSDFENMNMKIIKDLSMLNIVGVRNILELGMQL